MGRIFEAMNQAQALRAKGATETSLPTEATDAPSDSGPIADMPFVEVGGPRTQTVALSPPAAAAKVPARPVADRWDRLPTIALPGHPASPHYHQVLAALLANEGAGIYLMGAATAKTDAATPLLHLAMTAALEGRRVVAVEASLRRPVIARLLGMPEAPGLQEVLAGRCRLAEVLRDAGIPRLQVVTSGHPLDGRLPRLWLGGMPQVLSQFRRLANLMLLHAPAWDDGDEAAILSSFCEGAYLVANGSDPSELVERLLREGICLKGCLTVAE